MTEEITNVVITLTNGTEHVYNDIEPEHIEVNESVVVITLAEQDIIVFPVANILHITIKGES